MDRRHGPGLEFGPGVEQGDRALDLGRPDEADRPLRARQPAGGDEPVQATGDLEDSRAAAGIVVGARRRVIEMAGKNDLLIAPFARDHRGRDQIGPRRAPRLDLGAKPDRLTGLKPLLPCPGLGRRDHEGEGRMGAERVEMAPANQAFILAPPGGALVLRPGDDPNGAVAADGEIGDGFRLR